VREELKMSIVEPILNPHRFKQIGLSAPAGVLLYGPPGCGKTLVARAVANESKANFISIKGPELLNKYVGESEKAVRSLFKRANSSAPCVIFFDELDSLCPKRGSENNSSSERVVNQLLTEMDGLEDRDGVYVIAATNRPDIIDPAMLRPGRLDKLLYVPLPSKEDRLEILKTACRKVPISSDVNLQEIAFDAACQGYSGADLAALVREAQLNTLREVVQKNIQDSTGVTVG
jgi:ribosome biogenesis ATPase